MLFESTIIMDGCGVRPLIIRLVQFSILDNRVEVLAMYTLPLLCIGLRKICHIAHISVDTLSFEKIQTYTLLFRIVLSLRRLDISVSSCTSD